MKNIIVITLLFLLSSTTYLSAKRVDKRVIVAYVVSGSQGEIETEYITHINYAFAHVGEDFCSIDIDKPERLKEIAALKKGGSGLKVMLSIGGWGSGRFSEMAASDSLRSIFANNCIEIVEHYSLDGIDIDWEYPTISSAGISASKNDTENFTLLMRDIRKAIGKRNLLTLASVASGKYIDFKAIDKYVDFINVMTYDISRPPYHHAPLYRSKNSGDYTCQEAIEAHIKNGVAAEKLVLGVPFYGRGDDKVGNFINYNKLIELEGYKQVWDEESKVPYLANDKGEMACSYDNPRSIGYKAEYIKEAGLLGIMYWQYSSDDNSGPLRKAAYEGMAE